MPGPGDRGGKKERPRDTRGTLRRVIKYLMAYRWLVLVLLLCAFLSNIGNLLGPRFAGKAIGLAEEGFRQGPGHVDMDGVVRCALLMLAGILLAWWAVWRCCSSPEQFLTIWTEDTSFIGEGDGPAYSGRSSQTMATVGAWLFRAGLVTALIGMAALVKARTRDRRWAAVYLLALTAAVLTLAVLAMLENFSSLNPLCDVVPANWFQPYLPRFAVITAAGLVGAGAALW